MFPVVEALVVVAKAKLVTSIRITGHCRRLNDSKQLLPRGSGIYLKPLLQHLSPLSELLDTTGDSMIVSNFSQEAVRFTSSL